MPRHGLLTKMLKQRAVYWALDGFDNFGKPAHATGVEIKVRWENTQEEFIDATGTRRVSSAVVYTQDELLLGGELLLGTLDDVADLSTPPAIASEILHFSKTPSLTNNRTLMKAML